MFDCDLISCEEFLTNYWQKKPFLFKNALKSFESPLSIDELAGLALEEEIESRLIINQGEAANWQIKQGPFAESELSSLPASHWTLLIKGVDRVIPQLSSLLDYFDFIPPWRLDDIMISIAAINGGVGPHYDNYDVFLLQASGQRKWSLSTKKCNEANHIENLSLRIMAEFEVEKEYIVNPGDILYLPPHIAHDGVSLSDDCMTYSIGYRSYQAQELWDSYGDYLAQTPLANKLYRDPDFSTLTNSAEIPKDAYLKAKILLKQLLDDDLLLQQWFSRFATQLDATALQLQAPALTSDELPIDEFMQHLKNSNGIIRDTTSRIGYHYTNNKLQLFINAEPISVDNATDDFIKLIAANRQLSKEQLSPYLETSHNQKLLYKLYLNQNIQLA